MIALDKKTRIILISAAVIGGSFYLGIIFYSFMPSFNNNKIHVATVRQFGPQLEIATDRDFELFADNKKIVARPDETKKWLEDYIRNYSSERDIRISNQNIQKYLEPLAITLATEPVNAKIKFQNSKADIFTPSVNGRRLNMEASISSISSALIDGRASASLSFDIIEPEITLDKINNLGINALIASGESDYGKSPSSRINNIRVGMAKFNGIILKPGGEFSFNQLLGEVEEKDGFQAELVIKNGQLVKEYGGGLCQVSTTIFRAAIMAGFPINERKPHSFPVQYYNPQGFDSTIYPGIVDLKFTNDTSGHVLIQTRLIGSKLLVEIYGSGDGRKVSLDGPYQYDQKPTGAMKAYFVRNIYQNDELIKEERFDSVYKAPPASPLEKNPLE